MSRDVVAERRLMLDMCFGPKASVGCGGLHTWVRWWMEFIWAETELGLGYNVYMGWLMDVGFEPSELALALKSKAQIRGLFPDFFFFLPLFSTDVWSILVDS